MSEEPRENRGARANQREPKTGEQYRAAMSALAEIAVQWEKKEELSATSSPEKLLLTTSEAAERLGIGRTTLYELIRAGKLRTIKIGRRRLIPATAIPKMIATLIEESEDT